MTSAKQSRRQFLKSSGYTFAFSVAGVSVQLTPADARAKGASFSILNASQVITLESIADGIVPGAKQAGIAHYLDTQLANSIADSLLMLPYLGVPPPYSGFYLSSLDSISVAASALYKEEISQLNETQVETIIEQMAAGKLVDWKGPPAAFFYFVLRSDAVDLVYGTQQGFDHLGIPAMQHIVPDSWW